MSLNKVILIGNVGKDPEVKTFESGMKQATFPLATSERGYKLQNGTEVPERTEWHNIVVRRDPVEFVQRFVKKGSQLYVEGKIHSRSYEDSAGNKRYVTEIFAERVEFFGSRRPDNNGQQNGATPTATTTQTGNVETFNEPVGSTDEPADDLPF